MYLIVSKGWVCVPLYNTVRKGIQPVTPIWITYDERKCIQLGTMRHIMASMTYKNMSIIGVSRDLPVSRSAYISFLGLVLIIDTEKGCHIYMEF